MNKTILYLNCLLFSAMTALHAENAALATATAQHPVLQAAIYGDVKQLNDLIDNGTDLNVTDEIGANALMYAAANGYVDCVEALLNAGANVKAHDVHGKTPLQFALLGKIFTFMAPLNKAVKRVILTDYDKCIAAIAAKYESAITEKNK